MPVGKLISTCGSWFHCQLPHLESIVLGECHNLHDLPNSGKDLEDDVECDRVHHVLHDHPERAWMNGLALKFALRSAKMAGHSSEPENCVRPPSLTLSCTCQSLSCLKHCKLSAETKKGLLWSIFLPEEPPVRMPRHYCESGQS